VPSAGSWHHPYPSFELWLQGLFFASLCFFGFFTVKTNLIGPLRYGYRKHSDLISTFSQYLPNWSPYVILLAFTLLPMSRVWLMGAVPVVWQYTLQQYREAVREITDKVDDACSRATIAANNAHEHAMTAARYEAQALDIAAVALRDERLAQYIKVTDFFDRSTQAWAELGSITDAAEAASAAAKTALGDARRVRDSEPPGGDRRAAALAVALFEKAKIAQGSAEKAEETARYTQAKVTESQTARNQDGASRRKESENARLAVSAAENLTARIANTSAVAFGAAAGAEKVRWFAGQAKAAAVQGLNSADSWAVKANDAVGKVIEAEREVAAAKEDARKILFNLQLGKPQPKISMT
jgi:hypothetical protein